MSQSVSDLSDVDPMTSSYRSDLAPGNEPVRSLAMWEHRAIWRIYNTWMNGTIPDEATGATRTPDQHKQTFFRTVRTEALIMSGVAVFVLALVTVFEPVPVVDLAGLASVLAICLIGWLALVTVPWAALSWRRRAARAPDPPIVLHATPDTLTVSQGEQVLISAPWTRWYPSILHYPRIVYRRQLTGLTLTLLDENGAIMPDMAVTVGDEDSYTNGTALLRVCLKGLIQAGRLAYD